MSREKLNSLCQRLPNAADGFVDIDAEVIEEREKAVLLESMTGTHSKRAWVPVSQLGAKDRGQVFGLGLCVKKSWVSRNKLWWMT